MTEVRSPWMWLVGGPDGAGKTTFLAAVSPALLDAGAAIDAGEVVHALEESGVEPGDELDRRADEIIAARVYARIEAGLPFACEHWLDSRVLLDPMAAWRQQGGRVGLVYIRLHGATMSLDRLAARAEAGGEPADGARVRRRFSRGIRNLAAYMDAADAWLLIDNAGAAPKRIAEGGAGRVNKFDIALFHGMCGARREKASDRPLFAGDWSARVAGRFAEAVRRRTGLERLARLDL